ncbi:hypothetical protein CFP65_2587 [Kitasatospora sp. MMS16-BH015]|uniref:YidC/Oxa1 family membrane protein insertase n=1 Tax=Kitasatospora sp. MMS16-BH015 TaxID=2018025 RepID=UPI000CA39CA4|nr:YidC/Oxa1 family membrane protein insertase [Kitasatospora sp. MMS16-BH015]AUG77412.1 hypothetical protein CFP65_2587 [Kitasatospora sp. MMS16-BH015]
MSLFAVLDPAVRLAHQVVAGLAQVVPTALAIVLFTAAVRLALHPLARSAARAEKTRTRLAPKVAALQKKHGKDPERLRTALAELYRAEQASPFAGFLPLLVQLPFFSVMYRLFTTPNDLLGHTLFGVPLGLHVGSAHGPAQWLVFAALYAALAGVGYVGFRRARRAAAQAKAQGTTPLPGTDLMSYLAFGTVLFAALVPLAAGLYLLTTTAWTAAERALLHGDVDVKQLLNPHRRGALH